MCTNRDEEIIVKKKECTLEYLPKGYLIKNYEVLGNVINMEFINNQGDKIRFSYRPENSITNFQTLYK